MLKKLCLLLSLLLVNLSLIAQYSGDRIFDNSYIHEIEINTNTNLASMFDIYFEEIFEAERTYALATIIIDGNALDSIGVRVKGGISAFDNKKPLKIDFNEFVSGRKYDGLKKLNLHQGSMDKSFIREKLAYDLFRNSGVKTVRTAYAKVYFNGNYEGLYILVEQIDDTFLNELFASADGALYKTGISGLGLKYQIDSSLTYTEFETRVKQIPIDNLDAELPAYLDIETFNKFIAHEIFLGNNDGPLIVDQNYYIYYEPKSKVFVYVPWDYNLVLYGSRHNILQESSNFIFEKIKDNPVLLEDYLTSFCSLLEHNFNEEFIFRKITEYETLIREAVMEDPYFTDLNFNQEIEFIKTLVSERVNELRLELNALVTDCDQSTSFNFQDISINELVASNSDASGITDSNGASPDWIELYNNTNSDIAMGNLFLSNDVDFLKHWKFPDSLVIAKEEYMIIWADRDLKESGIHADFKLNKSKGALYLSSEDGSILDSVVFKNQITDVALARVPNGIGEFRMQPPTFSGNNNGSLVDNDDDGFDSTEDCDDNNPNINPGQIELPYNGLDDDCNAATLDDDLDQDGFFLAEDCDDNNSAVNPSQIEVPYNGVDDDCDTSSLDDDLDKDGFPLSEDCDDLDAAVSPGSLELCDDIDNNCNGLIDDGLASLTYYLDEDGDGYGSAVFMVACAQPDGYVTEGGDCDDSKPSIFPNAPELCDAVDNDCNGIVDDAITIVTFYLDIDGDGYGSNVAIDSCAQPIGYVTITGDCNDNNQNIYPNQIEEPYNGVDDDCNSATLDDDLDQDGFLLADDCDDNNSNINPNQEEEPYNGVDDDCNSATLDDDLDQDGFLLADDCDDNNSNINPNQEEEPYNGVDDDCNSATLDDDLDQDGFLLVDDCDDNNSNINPSQEEEPYNGVDEDCNLATLDDDLDQDGFLIADDCDDNNALVNPSEVEVAYNGINDDCNAATLDDDLDQDGFLLADDCNDNDFEINPEAEEIPNNGVDEDCDGSDLISSTYSLSNSIINIYPNPSIESVNIDIDGQLDFEVSLFDLAGKLIFRTENSYRISVGSYHSGTYLLEIRDSVSGQKIIEKIVVGR